MTAVREGLSHLVAYDGVTLALLVGRDGLLIDGIAKSSDSDLDSVAAIVSNLTMQAERVGTQIEQGTLAQMILEFGAFFVVVEPLGEDVLVVGATKPANLGLLRTAMKRHRDEVLAAAQTY
jgi:predicted regulator of Ras-like GTPase activity (Roadblock/LC7/MglB family)